MVWPQPRMRSDVLTRQAQVTAVSADAVMLRLLGSSCAGCSDGCGGRCNVFARGEEAELSVPRERQLALLPGQTVTLALSDRALRNAAYAGYGRALLAMLVGAISGHWLGIAVGLPSDPLAFAGLVVGVVLAARWTGDARLSPTLSANPILSVSSSPSFQESQEPL